MSDFSFIQINNRNIQETIAQIDSFANTFIIGFEVVNPEIIKMLDVNIDPQHTGVTWYEKQYPVENVSAAKWLLKKLPTLPIPANTTCVIEKLDIDALAALILFTKADLLSSFENDPVHHEMFLELCDRVTAINTMDCGLGSQGIEWDANFYKSKLNEGVSDFNVLGAMCSDFRCDINFKHDAMLRWLTLGALPEKYLIQQQQEFEKEQSTKIETLYGVTCVQTQARNVSSIIYAESPYGVAYNPSFPVKDGTVPKFTIMAFNGRDYIDFDSLLFELNQEEPGWGGNLSAGIVGSPFGGTKLTPDQVCDIVSGHIYG